MWPGDEGRRVMRLWVCAVRVVVGAALELRVGKAMGAGTVRDAYDFVKAGAVVADAIAGVGDEARLGGVIGVIAGEDETLVRALWREEIVELAARRRRRRALDALGVHHRAGQRQNKCLYIITGAVLQRHVLHKW